MPHFEGPRVTSSDALERLKELGPWFYEFDLGEYGRTESELPLEVRPVHESRLAMVERVVDEHRGRNERYRAAQPNWPPAVLETGLAGPIRPRPNPAESKSRTPR